MQRVAGLTGVYAVVTADFEGIIGSIAAYTGIDPGWLPIERILFIVIIYLSVVFGGAVFIRKLFNLIQELARLSLRIMGSNAVLNNIRMGKVIGIFERLVVLTILTVNVNRYGDRRQILREVQTLR
ncbi:MAG: hypothetical protein KBI09_09930 [Mesotoga sp.]|nr:hypothetical protein [Mesotoga sp.]NLI07789.1 hypothetical protein [Thermotogaceae bacterium]